MKKVLIETSARHIHVSKSDLEALFGEGHELTKIKDLSQPGQFACDERLVIVGPKGELGARILGPVRPATQVEISLTDARSIGLNAPIRESGDIAGTLGCKLVNPKNGNSVEIKEGVIAAKRHIHLTPEAAAEMNVVDKEIVSVKISSERTAVLGDVVIRVSDKFAPAMHIDTDEANAACAFGEIYGEIVK